MDGNLSVCDKTIDLQVEPSREMRPGENMSLGESLQSLEENRFHLGLSYSGSPQTPISECSSYGTSPNSDVDIPTSLVTGAMNGNDSGLSEPIPIPSNNCLHDSLSRLKC